jgi:hypothetical protein
VTFKAAKAFEIMSERAAMLADVVDQVSLIYRVLPLCRVVYDHNEPFRDCRKAPVNRVIPMMRRTQSVLWAFWLSALVVAYSGRCGPVIPLDVGH